MTFNEMQSIINKWIELIDGKNAVCFGDEQFNHELFHNAMVNAYSCFKTLKEQNEIPIDSINGVDARFYLRLISCMSEYAADCFVGDQSDGLVLTASQLATRLLLEKYLYSFLSNEMDTPILSGDFDYTVAERVYEYNIETGDLSDLMSFAELIS
jgi:hypothetical protein